MKIEGNASYVEGAGKTRKISGYGKIADETEFRSLSVEGSVSFGNIYGDKVKIDGECSGKSLTVRKIKIKGTVKADVIKAVECLKIEGTMKIGFVEAKEIVIEADAGKIGKAVCESIKVFAYEDVYARSLMFGHFDDRFSARDSTCVIFESVEAVCVELQNCRAKLVKCRSGVIGKNCMIDKLLVVGGDVEIDDDAKIGEVVRENFE